MEHQSSHPLFPCRTALPCKTKRANSRIGALFRGGLLRVVTRYYARRGRVITRLSVNKRGRTPKYLHSRALFRTNMGASVRGYARTSEIPRA